MATLFSAITLSLPAGHLCLTRDHAVAPFFRFDSVAVRGQPCCSVLGACGMFEKSVTQRAASILTFTR